MAQVRALLRDQFPNLAELPLGEPALGWDNAVFRLGDWMAVRMPIRRVGAELLSSEIAWLPRLALRLPLPVPEPLHVGRPGHGYPWSWTVVRWIAGTNAMSNPLVDDARSGKMLAGFLRALHRPAPPDAPYNHFRGCPLPTKQAHFDGHLPVIADEELRQAATAVFVDGMCAHSSELPTWIHGDLHAGNVVVDADRIVGIIDWGDTSHGDPAVDLVAAWSLLGPAARAAFCNTYRPDEAMWRRGKAWTVAIMTGMAAGDTRQAAREHSEAVLRQVCSAAA